MMIWYDSVVYVSTNASFDTVRRWKKKFDSWLESIENAAKPGRPKSASYDKIVSKAKEIVERDARYTVSDIARMVDISLSRVHYMNVRKISTRWGTRLLTDGQKKQS